VSRKGFSILENRRGKDMQETIFTKLDQILQQSKVVIDRAKGSAHPRYPDYIYPLDYGYLDGTQSQDGGGIDVWVGSGGSSAITGILVIVDALKKDSEIKVLLGCDREEMNIALRSSNKGDMAAVLIERGTK
jgi:inorganic pyrophosphatase